MVLAARDQGKLDALAASLPSATPVLTDPSSSTSVDAAIAEAVTRHGRVDGVANCIGSLLLKPVHMTSDAEWAAVIGANLTTSFVISRSAVKAMMKNSAPPGGSIVLCASAVARTGLANHEGIAAAKAGVTGLALSAAATYAPQNIRVNVVAPGLTRTPLTSRITANETSLKASAVRTPSISIHPTPNPLNISFVSPF